MDDLMRSGFKYKTIAILVAATLTVSPCAFAGNELAPADCSSDNAKSIATAIGAVAGGLVGNQLGDGKAGAVMAGALVGAWLGNYIGSEIGRRHCELEKIAKANGVEVNTDQVELKEAALNPSDVQYQTAAAKVVAPLATGNVDIVRISGNGDFASSSANLTKNSDTYFSQMAQQYKAEKASEAAITSLEKEAAQQGGNLSEADIKKNRTQITTQFNQRPIVLVGHTDDTGDSLSNQRLSEKRARAVAALFKSKGIPASRIYYRGAGDIDPVADNHTEEGRKANRRVEIIELESKEKLENFIALKQSNPDYLRAKVSPADMVVNADDANAHRDSVKQQKVLAVAKASAKHTVASSKSGVDFGGELTSDKIAPEISKSMGKAIKSEKGLLASWSNIFVSEAQAADEKVYNLPCTADAPRYGGKYLSLATGKATKETKTAEYAPGMYQTSWVGVVNGNYLGLTPVGVLRANFQPVSQPNLLVWANTVTPGQARYTLKIPMQVNVYPGDKGILYRMYSTGKNNLVCADVVLPRHAPFAAPAGKLYSKRDGQVFESDYVPSMLAIGK